MHALRVHAYQKYYDPAALDGCFTSSVVNENKPMGWEPTLRAILCKVVTVPVVAAAILFWACVFMVYFTASATTPLEFFLGRYEAPPTDLGVWKNVGGDTADGLIREERYLLPEGRSAARHLHKQVRYRDPVTRAIVRVEPEQRVARRRVSSR